jgi:glutaminyl-tRNA synthetase
VAKVNSMVELAFLESCVREELNRTAPRAMAVLRPLKVVLTNYPEGQVEALDCVNNPENPAAGSRAVPFSRELYVERDDFLEDPPKKFFRLSPGREVRLRYAYFITCTEAVKDPATGEIIELRCTYDPATRGGDAPDGRSPKATLHWVSAAHAKPVEVRLYDTLFSKRDPSELEAGEDWKANLNPRSLEVVAGAVAEPSLAEAGPGSGFQFERQGYFTADIRLSKPGAPVFNRTVTLRDSWARIMKSGKENV